MKEGLKLDSLYDPLRWIIEGRPMPSFVQGMSFILRESHLSTQWAAVRTCWSVMRTPPQNWSEPSRSKAAIHGHSPLSAGFPPTMRALIDSSRSPHRSRFLVSGVSVELFNGFVVPGGSNCISFSSFVFTLEVLCRIFILELNSFLFSSNTGAPVLWFLDGLMIGFQCAMRIS